MPAVVAVITTIIMFAAAGTITITVIISAIILCNKITKSKVFF